MYATRLFFVTTLALFSFSCGTDSANDSSGSGSTRIVASAAATVQRFMDAVVADDQSVTKALLTTAAQRELEQNSSFQFSGEGMDSFVVGEELIEGEDARVELDIVREGETQSATMLLRKENSVWRIHGAEIAFGDGSFTMSFEGAEDSLGELTEGLGQAMGEALTEQFEDAFSEMQAAFEQGGTDEQIAEERATFEALEAMTVEEFEASWRVSVNGNGRAVAEVFEELLAGTGLEYDGSDVESFLSRQVHLDLDEVSRVEAVERFASEVGIHPVWPNFDVITFGDDGEEPAKLGFAEGKPVLPRQFQGPFLIEVAKLTEEAPRPVGSIEIAVRALGLPETLLSYHSEMGEFLRVHRVRDANGSPLTEEDMHHWGTPERQGRYSVFTLDKELSGLLRGVESIAELAGEVYLELPVSMEEFTLEGPGEELETSLGTVKVSDWGENVNFEIRGEGDALERSTARLSPRKESGGPLGTLSGGANSWGGMLNANLQCPETPAAIDVKLTVEERLVFEFRFEDVPLQQFAQQPERLLELEFDGKAPMTATLVGDLRKSNDQTEVTLELENHSNKDISLVMVEFVYLASDGSMLEDFPHTLMGEYDFDTQSTGPLVRAGERVHKDSFAAFLPKGTASVEFRLLQAEFPDGTEWRRDP